MSSNDGAASAAAEAEAPKSLMTDKGMDTTQAITTKTMTTLTTIAKETVTAAAISTTTAPKNPYDKIHKLGESQSTATATSTSTAAASSTSTER